MKSVVNNRLLFEKEDTYSLRGLCMLAIIVHHLFQFTAARYGVNYPLPIAIPLQSAGYLSVAVFFLISGYGMTLSLWKHKPDGSDALKRISKIYLPYLFFWLVCVVLIAFDSSRQFALSDLRSLVTFQLPYMGGGRWFIISILVLYCYLLILAQFVDTKEKAARIMLISTVFYILLNFTVLHLSSTWYNSIMAFPIGVFCAAKKDEIQKFNNRVTGLLFLSVFCVSYLLMLFSGTHYCPLPSTIFTPLFQIISSTALSLFAIWAVARINIRNNCLNLIGIYSLSVLLAHQVLVIFCAGRVSNVFLYVVSVLAGTFVLTWLYSKVNRLVYG